MRTTLSFGPIRHGARAALVGALLIAAAVPGEARDGRNGGLAAGVAGGVVAGALLGGAANQPPPPPPVEEYRPRRVVVEEPEEVVVRRPRGPVCHYERRKVWLNEEDFTYKRVEVCE
ncbi:hypothetical protein BHAOGJBA_0031 [Methylobacterium hispanicum]|uniref:Uncharacterized protein n=1 Tax=Methylobacterium hispanicum TaxID=270350 RepID=A0AAV4ZF51_9HYPH|nr:hypothetical protein [Methylobacterium hispanicum]GJD86538.1 hypothetical protein BHAOGJBA_0031 [Methylobacterium hispanicum]